MLIWTFYELILFDMATTTTTIGRLDDNDKENQQQEQENEGKEKERCLCQSWKLEELVLDRLTLMTYTAVDSLSDTMYEQPNYYYYVI